MAERQVIVFKLGESDEYCIDIGQVREIVRVQGVTPLPGTPSFVEGIVNLRGVVVPVVDIRKIFTGGELSTGDPSGDEALPRGPEKDTPRPMIVTTLGGEGGENVKDAGVLVSSVSEILRIGDGDIEEAPGAAEYISGVAKVGERLIVILDLRKVLGNEENLGGSPEKEKKKETKSGKTKRES